MFGEPTLPTIAGLGLEPVDEIDDIVKSPPCARLFKAAARAQRGQ
jgi:hypothetical protein